MKENKGSWPSIDHSFLSPSGKISKKSRDKYLKQFAKELFPKEMFPNGLQGECRQPSEKERLLSQAKRLRDLANNGMCVRKYNKEADRLELIASRITI
jgi:hypothetical protein